MGKKRTHHSVYRKIYKQHYGAIPVDEQGRSYEIHHIDNDHENNDPDNLKAVTIQEHYDIHYVQGDWSACLMMSERMKVSPEEKSRLATLHNKKLIEEGRHHFIGIDQSGKNNSGYDHTIYCFEHKDTKERVNSTRYEFYTKYNLSAHHITGLVHGNHRSVHGWTIIKIDIDGIEYSSDAENKLKDHTIYGFKHEKTGEVVYMTRSEFVRTYEGRGINRGTVSLLVKKKNNRKSAGGWMLVK
jgi:hypothetical protein